MQNYFLESQEFAQICFPQSVAQDWNPIRNIHASWNKEPYLLLIQRIEVAMKGLQ